MRLWSRPPELLVIECFPARLDPSSWVRGSAVTLWPSLSALCRLCRSPSDWGQRRSPPPQGAFISVSVLRTQSHHRWVSRQGGEGTVIVHVSSGSWRPTFSPRAVWKVLCDQAQAT